MIDEPRYHVFLSYHEQDEAAAGLIAERLRAEHGIEPWLRAWSAVPGRLSQAEQERGLAQSQACAVLIGAAGVRQWQQLDVYAAISRRSEAEGGNFPVIPVFLPECPAEAQGAMPAMLLLFEPVRLTTLDDQPGLSRLAAGVRGEPALSASITLPDEPAPYRGLLPFEAEHARFFFGRDDDVRRLVEKLGQQRFVAVVGASGSGKSSLVKAGLLPRLAQNVLPDSATWRVLAMTPGREPLRSLANKLVTLAPATADRVQTADALSERLLTRRDGLRTTLDAYLAEAPRPVLLFVDQFEELFTQCAEGPERCRAQAEQFVANLADAVQQGGGQVRVLVTLRADFLDRCLALPALRGLLEDRQVLLGPMDEPALREAIVRPAQDVGALFEKGLVNVILRDVGDEPGRLPLLEHALHELWLARRGPWLMLEAYERSGGVQGALNRRAQATYDALDAELQQIARNIFLRLTALGEGVADTRRRARREELNTVGAAREAVDAVVQALAGGEARLLVVDGESVQVAHEALIQGWDTLRRWLEEDRDALRVQQRLTMAAVEWNSHGRTADYLYRGARLAQVEEWLAGSGGGLNEVEIAFVRASVEMRERETVEREAQRRRELEQAQKLAETERLRAEEAEGAVRRAWADELTLFARIELAEKMDRSGSLALILAQNAVLATWREGEEANGFVMVNADKALRDAVDAAPPHRKTLRGHADSVQSAAYSPDGTQVVTASSDRTARIWDVATGQELCILRGHNDWVNWASYSPDGNEIVTAGGDSTARIWDAVTGGELRTLRGHTKPVTSAAFSPDGKHIVTAGADRTARIWDARTGCEERILSGHSDCVWRATYRPDGRQIVTASDDHTARIWDVKTGRIVRTLSDPRGSLELVTSAAYSPDGRQIVTASGDGTARIWNARTGKKVRSLGGHNGSICCATWSPHGQQIVTADHGGMVRIWDTESGQELRSFPGHPHKVNSADYSPDGWHIVTASNDDTARIWDVTSGLELRTLRGHRDWVKSATYSPDGQFIVTASDDAVAGIWSTSTGQVVRGLHGHADSIWSAVFSPDGRQIVTASVDKTVCIWDAMSGQKLRIFIGHSFFVESAAYSPDGRFIITASWDKTARIWDAATGDELRILSGHTDPVKSAAYRPDGRFIVTTSWDNTARIWDAATGDELRILSGHTGRVNSAVYSPNGRHIVTASDDETARIWNAATGDAVRTLSGHNFLINSAAYSPDGRHIVTASADRTARIWLSINDLLAEAARLTQRNPPQLTPQERQRFGLGW